MVVWNVEFSKQTERTHTWSYIQSSEKNGQIVCGVSKCEN
ncbi:hypothetical protein WwAna1499, partial [Wolbachia endosymbiont of Drosophila ananassae]